MKMTLELGMERTESFHGAVDGLADCNSLDQSYRTQLTQLTITACISQKRVGYVGDLKREVLSTPKPNKLKEALVNTPKLQQPLLLPH
jgi:hypothetical protein